MAIATSGGANVTGANIVDSSISNADISPSANVDLSKINAADQIDDPEIADDILKTATVNISSANILNWHSTPIELVAAPGAGKLIVVEHIILEFTAGGTPYANGDSVIVSYNNGTTPSLVGTIASSVITSATDTIAVRPMASAAADGHANHNVTIRAQSTAFITGNGTAKVFIKYRIITL